MRFSEAQRRLSHPGISSDSGRGLTGFKEDWGRLKYRSLVKALEWRHEGNRHIAVGYVWKTDGLRLVFNFHVGRTDPYITETDPYNLAKIIPDSRLNELIGTPDNVSHGRDPKHSLVFDERNLPPLRRA